MAECVVNTLLAADPCYATLNPHLQEVIITQMLCNILGKLEGTGTVTCVIQELLDQAVCYIDLPDSVLKVLQAQLLCNITAAL